MRYKIDTCDWVGDRPFALYQEQEEKGFLWRPRKQWRCIRPFTTREKAKEFYEQIKDLPEYLG